MVFGVLALVLEVLLSVKAPTVESMVTVAFALVAVISVIVLIVRGRRNMVEVSDVEAKGKRDIDNALKLANEIKPYIRKKDGMIFLKIMKK